MTTSSARHWSESSAPSTRRADLGPRHVKLDWTEGCIAVTNREMDILWAAIDDGTIIEILPILFCRKAEELGPCMERIAKLKG